MTDTALDEILAKQAITEVLYNYCRSMDRMDRELGSTVWHSGGTADYSARMYQGTGEGFLDWVWEQHKGMERHSHQIANVLIEVDGERAASEAYVTAALRMRQPDGSAVDIESRGRYVDQWERRDGRWAIVHRRFVEDLTNVYPVMESWMTETDAVESRRDATDPSYEVLGV
jgi:hypothetical protein